MSYDINSIYSAFEQRFDDSRVKYHHARANKKLVGTIAFNVAPLITCDDCTHETCATHGCYAIKNMLCHGYDIEKNNCLRAWIDNAIMLISETDAYFENVRKDIKSFKRKNDKKNRLTFVRVHASGDFYSPVVMRKWFKIANEFSDVYFLAYTKRYKFVLENIDIVPANFSLIISAWNGLEIPQELVKRFPVAYVNDDIRKNNSVCKFVCPGSCDGCKMCWYALAKHFDIEFIKH